MLKDFRDKKHQPITAQQVREELAAEERRKREELEKPIRTAEAALTESHKKLYEFHKKEVQAGRPDPGWECPTDALDLSMSVDEAKRFVQEQSRIYCSQHPDYFPCEENFRVVMNYLCAQKPDVFIPTAACFELAVERLRLFGLIRERPEPEPVVEQTPEQIEQEAPPQDQLTDGWDIQTGQPRKFTQREIHQMSSSEFKRAFRMWVTSDGEDRRAKFSRSRYQ